MNKYKILNDARDNLGLGSYNAGIVITEIAVLLFGLPVTEIIS